VQHAIAASSLSKQDRSPVTIADFGSQAVVCRALLSAFPEDPVIAEEDSAALRQPENRFALEKVVDAVRAQLGDVSVDEVVSWIDRGRVREQSDRYWTLDPIDGTKGFLRGEQYAVALALVVQGRVSVAALACPNLPADGRSLEVGTVYSAVRGHGATSCTLSQVDGHVEVRASPLRSVSESRFCESVESGHSSHSDAETVAGILGITRPSVRLDSQAKYAVVARGEAEIYMRLPTRPGYVENIWDHAAGMLVVEEAGGRVTDVEGRPLDFRYGGKLVNNRGVIATNGHVHDDVLQALLEAGVAQGDGPR
jgi:3'(2'), 5'-bisphosphate nucleotidase